MLFFGVVFVCLFFFFLFFFFVFFFVVFFLFFKLRTMCIKNYKWPLRNWFIFSIFSMQITK